MKLHEDGIFQIIAHRGASREAPENTMSAFELAVEQGAHAIEMDIHISKDRELVVCHDPTVNRTTNGTGRISQMTWRQLKQLDAGSWFSPRFQGEPLPMLEQVVEQLPQQLWFNLEIKMRSEYQQLGLTEKLADFLSQHDLWGRTVISSFDMQAILDLKRLDPRLMTALLFEKGWLRRQKVSRMLTSDDAFDQLYSIHPRHNHMKMNEAEFCKKQGLRLYPWTVNSSVQMKKWIERGASGIITDRPKLLKEVLVHS